jgi:opacity protein-like surface antigen
VISKTTRLDTVMRSFLLALALALALAAPAMAQDATQEGYSPDGPAVLDQTENRGDPAGPSSEPSSGPSSDGASTLPFTGMDLVLVAGFGLGLLGLGAGMRRLTRPAGPVSS